MGPLTRQMCLNSMLAWPKVVMVAALMQCGKCIIVKVVPILYRHHHIAKRVSSNCQFEIPDITVRIKTDQRSLPKTRNLDATC